MSHNKKSHVDFIAQVLEKHGGKYDYAKTLYIKSSLTIEVLCPKHGYFKQRASHHLNGAGCNSCGREKTLKGRRLTTDIFVSRATETHKGKYGYSLTEYVNNRTKVDILCKKHGLFKQSPDKHLGGCGCTLCGIESTRAYALSNSAGYKDSAWQRKGLKSNNFDSFKVYLVKLSGEDEVFYKIGKTYNTVNRRLRNLKSLYDIEIVSVIDGLAGRECCELERRLHRVNTFLKYKPYQKFSGENECFIFSKVLIFKGL